jgi:PPOX class probable F420-dependent enzyme
MIAAVSAIDASSEHGARADERLRAERTIWLATIAADGGPAVRPVWFVWDGDSILVFSRPTAAKVGQIAANSRVCLHLDPDEWGENVVIVFGEARLAPEHAPVDETAAYVEKYGWGLERLGVTAAEYARDYSVPIVIEPTRLLAY